MLTHEAAAAVSFWPSISVPTVRCVVRHARRPHAGFAFSRGHLPAELVWRRGPLRLTAPALTALDLCETMGGDAIDHALRRRATTIGLMRQALASTPRRAGNPRRRQLLLDSRDEPWSAAERNLHGLLRTAGITGWSANQSLRLGDLTVHPDIMFRRLRLVIEVDGRAFHSDADAFETDRRRQNLLVLHGWRVLRVTWTMIQSEPDQVIAMVREAMAMAAVA